MGLGERVGNFLLKPGNYTLLPGKTEYGWDNGYGERQGYGQHPFLMIQLNSTRFIGVYLANMRPAQVSITPVLGSDTDSILTFRVIGGNLDFYFFGGPNYNAVVQEY
jgi:alpha-glucosidase